MALGNLEGYVAKSMQQMLGKLTNGFMSSVMGMVRGFVQGQIGGLLGQVADLADLHGITEAIADPLGAAEALALDVAAGGSHGVFNRNLDTIGAAFAGTPGEAAFALLRGQFGGALGGPSMSPPTSAACSTASRTSPRASPGPTASAATDGAAP